MTRIIMTFILALLAAGCAAKPGSSKSTTTTIKWISQGEASKEPGSKLAWYDAKKLLVEGRGWPEEDGTTFTRLPMRAKDVAAPAVWRLAHNTAGICVSFLTDATTISALWEGGVGMGHMAYTGSNGLDLYASIDNQKWQYIGTGRPGTTRTLGLLSGGRPAEPTHYMLYLPLYANVPYLKIGIPPTARIAPGTARAAKKPIVFYGTSITQGGCASRAGMNHTSILGRWLDREVINLGFSGSGKMELPLAHLFAELDPAVYVLECLPNMTTEMVSERVALFVKVLRDKHPITPIMLVENPLKEANHPQNVALRGVFRDLEAGGMKHLRYLEGLPQLEGKENGTVDGAHPTDLGFNRMAEYYYPRLKALLK